MTRRAPLLLAVLVLGLLVAGPLVAPRALVLVRARDRVLAGGGPRPAMTLPPGLDTPTERVRLARATPDDLARGILALSALPREDPQALSTTQRTALLAAASRGAEARARRDEIRTEVRRAETAWLDSGANLWRSLPSRAREALRVRAAEGSTPAAGRANGAPLPPPTSTESPP